MHEFKSWHNEALAARVVDALKKNNFTASYVPTKAEAIEKVLALIPGDATVGIGGSWTLSQLELPKKLEERGNTVLNHNKPGLPPEEALKIRRQQLTCDVFLTSTNAITLDGKLVNVDGAGNRVAAMIFGPKKTIIVAGTNKIAFDVADAEKRIKLHAAPVNNKRLDRPNPCTTTGQCMDCQGPTRICNVTTIINKRPSPSDIEIILVGEELGF
ncbi:MAG: lactate utilization protein [Negativicutes bacterium]|nr:lactate utilization protein [Negativicutes bacterium]